MQCNVWSPVQQEPYAFHPAARSGSPAGPRPAIRDPIPMPLPARRPSHDDLLAYLVTEGICLGLQRRDLHLLEHGPLSRRLRDELLGAEATRHLCRQVHSAPVRPTAAWACWAGMFLRVRDPALAASVRSACLSSPQGVRRQGTDARPLAGRSARCPAPHEDVDDHGTGGQDNQADSANGNGSDIGTAGGVPLLRRR